MPDDSPRSKIEQKYFRAAQDYLRRLSLENQREATGQATQRFTTLASLGLLRIHIATDQPLAVFSQRHDRLMSYSPPSCHRGQSYSARAIKKIRGG